MYLFFPLCYVFISWQFNCFIVLFYLLHFISFLQREYRELSKQCSKLATDLLNQCRNTEEVQTVLVQRKGFSDPRPHRFSRLHLAVQYEQKEVRYFIFNVLLVSMLPIIINFIKYYW